MTRWLVRGVCAALAVAVLMIYTRTGNHTLINYLDDVYVYENPAVKGGLTKQGYAGAFTQAQDANWIPLTFLTHTLDFQVFGYQAGWHHLASVLLYLVTIVVLFLVLHEMTGKLWPSAFAAALFAVHPLRVEAVAWVAQRKDVLSGLFFVLTLWAHTYYVRKPSLLRYPLASFAFALSLMSKPMLVTTPFVLLLLDYWPLRRYATKGEDPLCIPRGLWKEKIPLFVMSAAACLATLWLHRGLMDGAEAVPLLQRIGNAAVSYVVYLKQFIWPFGLAPYYPLNLGGLFVAKALLSALLLAVISTLVFRWRKQYPWLWTGWFWYLGMLVPVLGLVQIGGHAHADRYTYLPHIGLVVALTWAVAAGSVAWRKRTAILGTAAGVVLAGLIFFAHRQAGYWRNSDTIWTHTLACTPNDNLLVHNLLANFLVEHGNRDRAMAEARMVLAVRPTDPLANNCLGYAILQEGRPNEAIFHFELALEARPGLVSAERNLGTALIRVNRMDDAISHLKRALELAPDQAGTHASLGTALLAKGQAIEAVEQFETALRINPDTMGAADRLAWVRATSTEKSLRNGLRAIDLAERVNDLTHGTNVTALRTLAAAQAEATKYPEAIRTASKALDLAQTRANNDFIRLLQRDIGLYQSEQPLRTDFTRVESAIPATNNMPSLW